MIISHLAAFKNYLQSILRFHVALLDGFEFSTCRHIPWRNWLTPASWTTAEWWQYIQGLWHLDFDQAPLGWTTQLPLPQRACYSRTGGSHFVGYSEGEGFFFVWVESWDPRTIDSSREGDLAGVKLSWEAKESTLVKFRAVICSQPISGIHFIEKRERKSNESRQQTLVSLWPWGYMESLFMSSVCVSTFNVSQGKAQMETKAFFAE